ncbi:MAG: RHS repeat-associated core domain-containing protein, partial [Candidatus Sulfotelmatobacter sp.]
MFLLDIPFYRTRLGGTSYDISGNLLNDTFHTYTWDAYGDMASIDGNAITYDALSQEVEKSNPTQQILYGPLGKMGIMNGQTWVFASIPLPGGSTMLKGQVPGIVYAWVRHANYQGTVTVESTLNGRAVNSDKAFGPFGEQYNTGAAGNGDTVWAGISPDTVAGTYDALYRKYNPNQGRWVSPDPSGLNAVDPSNPQTWNRYAYVLNNPLRAVDPLGLDCVYLSDDASSIEEVDADSDTSPGDCASSGGTHVNGYLTGYGSTDSDGTLNEFYSNAYSVQNGSPNGMPNPSTLTGFLGYYAFWQLGLGPTNVYYGPGNSATQQMKQTAGVAAARSAYVAAGCPANSGPLPTGGHLGPVGDQISAAASGSPNFTEMEVGGFNASASTSNGVTTFNLTNTSGQASFS